MASPHSHHPTSYGDGEGLDDAVTSGSLTSLSTDGSFAGVQTDAQEYGLSGEEEGVADSDSEGGLTPEPSEWEGLADSEMPLELDEGSSGSSDALIKRTDVEWAQVEQEIGLMKETIEGLEAYDIVDKLGEGTFSTVYKAIDLHHDDYDNLDWASRSPMQGGYARSRSSHGRVYVALKRIYVTSSPQRILNELELLESLRPCANVAYLISAFRSFDQIVVVMPYARHQDFRDYYRVMPLCDLRLYLRCLFTALEGAHAQNIIHRDIKPANFLYDPRSGTGVLADWGLAERFEPSDWRSKCHHTCPTQSHPHGQIGINNETPSIHTAPGGLLHPDAMSSKMSTKGAMGPPVQPASGREGYLKEDHRPSCRANRAGTRGFRAPEVLLKCMDQTVALDIWSTGIILLAFLTKRFPLFNANDDTEALLELTCIFGRKRMQQCALLHNRTFSTNVPFQDPEGRRIPDFIRWINPGIMEPPADHPEPELYQDEIDAALDLCKACLTLDCTKRITAQQALQHPFLSEL